MQNKKLVLPVLGALSMVLAGCLHDETSVETAQYEFVHQTFKILDSTESIITTVSDDLDQNPSFSTSDESSSSESSPFPTIFKAMPQEQHSIDIISMLKNTTDWRAGLDYLLSNTDISSPLSNLGNKIETKILHESADTTEDEFGFSEKQVNESFNEIFNTPTRVNDVITYTFKSDVCNEKITAQERVDCIDVLSRIAVVFTIISDTNGTVDIKVDNFTPLTYSYSETRLSLSIDLDDVKQSANSFSQLLGLNNSTNAFPETFTGKLGVYVELLNSDKAEVGITVSEAINIDGSFDGETIKFTLASSDKIIAFIVDKSKSTASIELGLGSMIAMFSDSENDLFEFNIPELTGLLSVDNLNSKIDISNFGIGSLPMTFEINNMQAIELSVAKINGIIDMMKESVTLDSDLDVSLTANNTHELLNDLFDNSTDNSLGGTLSITASSGFSLVNLESDNMNDQIAKIDAGGPLMITGTDYFELNGVVDTGECFVWNDSTTGFGDGFQSGDCSIWTSVTE